MALSFGIPGDGAFLFQRQSSETAHTDSRAYLSGKGGGNHVQDHLAEGVGRFRDGIALLILFGVSAFAQAIARAESNPTQAMIPDRNWEPKPATAWKSEENGHRLART
jgi:hypothetical protein